jgi:hypothetical protein
VSDGAGAAVGSVAPAAAQAIAASRKVHWPLRLPNVFLAQAGRSRSRSLTQSLKGFEIVHR